MHPPKIILKRIKQNLIQLEGEINKTSTVRDFSSSFSDTYRSSRHKLLRTQKHCIGKGVISHQTMIKIQPIIRFQVNQKRHRFSRCDCPCLFSYRPANHLPVNSVTGKLLLLGNNLITWNTRHIYKPCQKVTILYKQEQAVLDFIM